MPSVSFSFLPNKDDLRTKYPQTQTVSNAVMETVFQSCFSVIILNYAKNVFQWNAIPFFYFLPTFLNSYRQM